MNGDHDLPKHSTYTNPIYPGYFGDPFVLRYEGEYYAYGTVPLGDCSLPVLRSPDLVTWREAGTVLSAAGKGYGCLWAPEVAHADGAFYMYYSAGGEEGHGHQLRVAAAPKPAGPFEDVGSVLDPDDPFTIDAHPFRDEDGAWYLFYCRDFLETEGGNKVGTGIVVDRLLGMTRLAGERRTVVRATAEWQVFRKQRTMYGRVWDWYTVEGPFVRRHDGRYYCFYSGGAWTEPNYGVSYVVADHPLGPWEPVGANEGPLVLQTRPGEVVGPGHASITVAPDGRQEYIVYHAWDPAHTARTMRMDRLDWTPDGPTSPGPTTTPQPAPPG